MTTNTWKAIGLGTVAMITLLAANSAMSSFAREPILTQRTFERPAAFETNSIVGSEPNYSTYGLDTGHVTDW
jgi:hypothetical protein